MTEQELADVKSSFDMRAEYGSCLANLKGLDQTALALFPLLYHPSLVCLGEAPSDASDYSPVRSEITEAEMAACTKRMHSLADMWSLRGCHNWAPLIDGQQVTLAGYSSTRCLAGDCIVQLQYCIILQGFLIGGRAASTCNAR
jgi:hypothetical protein